MRCLINRGPHSSSFCPVKSASHAFIVLLREGNVCKPTAAGFKGKQCIGRLKCQFVIHQYSFLSSNNRAFYLLQWFFLTKLYNKQQIYHVLWSYKYKQYKHFNNSFVCLNSFFACFCISTNVYTVLIKSPSLKNHPYIFCELVKNMLVSTLMSRKKKNLHKTFLVPPINRLVKDLLLNGIIWQAVWIHLCKCKSQKYCCVVGCKDFFKYKKSFETFGKNHIHLWI